MHIPFRRIVVSVIATVLLGSLPTTGATVPRAPTALAQRCVITSLPASQATAIERIVRREMQRRRIPGLQIVIVRHGAVAFRGSYGVADIETGATVTPRSLFTLNSATKAFTGVAIAQLVQAGRLSLDTPASAFVPDWPAQWGVVSVRQLLTHVSGLPDILEQPRGQGTGRLVGDGDPDSAWATIRTRPVEAPPGTRFRYNQTNYVLLGKIIDRLTGMPFTRYIATHQFAPAGATGFAYGETRDIIAGRVRIYRYANGAVDGSTRDAPLEHAFDEFAPFMRTAGGLNGSATDVARWLIGLQNGRLLSPAALQMLWTPGRYADGRPTQWGMGWPLRSDERHPVATGIGGRRSAFFVYPKDDLSIVVLTNLAGANPEEFIGEIAGVFYPELRLANGGGLSRDTNRLRVALAAFPDDAPATIFARLRSGSPSFDVTEDDLNVWGGRLLAADRVEEGIRVLMLNTSLHPDSANTWDSLGEAYEAADRVTDALAAYRRSLHIDGSNEHARRRCSVLSAHRRTAPESGEHRQKNNRTEVEIRRPYSVLACAIPVAGIAASRVPTMALASNRLVALMPSSTRSTGRTCA